MIESVVLSVTGMKCGGCESNVSDKLSAIAGVVAVTASSKNAEVSVEFDSSQTSLDSIKAAITDAGYTVASV